MDISCYNVWLSLLQQKTCDGKDHLHVFGWDGIGNEEWTGTSSWLDREVNDMLSDQMIFHEFS